MGARLGGALWRFWSIRGYPREGRAWLTELLGLGGTPLSQSRASVLAGAGRLAYDQGDYAAARELHQQSLKVHRGLNDRQAIARSLGHLGDVAHQTGDYAAARELFEESVGMLRALDDRQGVAEELDKLGLTLRCLGDYVGARALYEEALAICRELGDRTREALILNNLGRVDFYRGEHAHARRLHEESLLIRRQVGDRRGMAISLADLGDVSQQMGDLASARTFRAESLGLWQQLEDPWGLAYCFESFAEYAAVVNQPALVMQLVAVATLVRETIHAPRSPGSSERIQALLNGATRRLGRQPAADAWRTGQLLSTEEAAEIARRLSLVSASLKAPVMVLSPREREVVTLITRGLTNRQIADALVIGERTVHTHVANIMAKLELSSRTQIATWGVEQGLR
jgi:ATP/maltotriose-dependent transcriptional regulator MalT